MSEIDRCITLIKSNQYKACIWGCGDIGKNCGYQAVKELGIEVDFYCDNNRQLIGKVINDGKMCVDYESLDISNVVFFVLVHEYLEILICEQLRKNGANNIITWTDICKMNVKKHFPFMLKNNIAIYTCAVGHYDEFEEVTSYHECCDYYYVTDKGECSSKKYNIIDVKDVIPSDISDYTRMNRYCKINAHKLFPEYRYSIYYDGNIKISSELVNCLNQMPITKIIALCENYLNDLYVEAVKRMETNRDFDYNFVNQIKKYWFEGMPMEFGNKCCGVLIREHNNPICKKLMNDWWNEVKKYSNRDQVSFPYVIWKNGYNMDDVGVISNGITDKSNLWFFQGVHNKQG